MRYLILALFVFLNTNLSAQDVIKPSVRHWLESCSTDEKIAVWVFFKDKGRLSQDEIERRVRDLTSQYPSETVLRRLASRSGRPFDWKDLPLYKPYIKRVDECGVSFRAFSRWLNAVSVEATGEQIQKIASLNFVKSIRRVSGRRSHPEVEIRRLSQVPAMYQYGNSYRQLEQLQIPQLHNEGYTGAGVKIAIFDTGFWLEHEAFAGINIVAEHDFISDDDTTSNQPGDPTGQHNHGTWCLSALAGYVEGKLIGPAFGGEFILAKTEDISMEEPVEEDWWIEACEWADSLGARVISSSLGYYDWYTYEDMDGETAPITNAADRAVLNGIVVVTAAGNRGNSSWQYIIAPADGDSVISVGSVDSTGTRSSFSSKGPTYDGRIKPTIMAMGEDTFLADPSDTQSYIRGDGTSFATPLVAGSIALMLEKHPQWTPVEILESITATGTRASHPDTLYGWGILQAYDASNFDFARVLDRKERVKNLAIYPNPVRDVIMVVHSPSITKASIYDVRGKFLGSFDLSPNGITCVKLSSLHHSLSSGIYYLHTEGVSVKMLVVR